MEYTDYRFTYMLTFLPDFPSQFRLRCLWSFAITANAAHTSVPTAPPPECFYSIFSFLRWI